MFKLHFTCATAAFLALLSTQTFIVHGQDQQPEDNAKNQSSSDLMNNKQKSSALLEIDFAHQFDLVNPKNKSSNFQWLQVNLPAEKCTTSDESGASNVDSESQLLLSNAAFVFGSPNFINVASLPFALWVSQRAGANASQAVYDAALQLKGSALAVSSDKILQARLLFACETFGTAEHPFSAEAVINAQDDPRLAAGSMFLSDVEQGLEFGIVLTNRGVWAAYNRNPIVRYEKKGQYRAFQVYRRLGNRAPNTFIEARIAINGAARETRYYVGGQVVWSVGEWGNLTAVSSDSNNTVVLETAGADEVIDIKFVKFFINNEHKMDQADPNRASSVSLKESKGLVRLTNAEDFYAPHMSFWDEKSKRASSLFNQGAKLSLSRLRIDAFPIVAQKQKS